MQKEQAKYNFYQQLSIAYRNAAMLMKCIATIHVEAAEDKLLWEKMFKHARPDDEFHFITYTRTEKGDIATGCTTCLNYKDFLSKDFFICIDSDYRYLLGERGINISHAIFQTYTYSIENHYCYAKGLDNVFRDLGFENHLFDFNSFLVSYSKILFEPFLYHLYSLSIRDGIFTKDVFKILLNIDKASLSAELMLGDIEKKVKEKLSEIKKYYTGVDINEIKTYYGKLGLMPENAYLYFRGHNIFERVVLPVAREVRKVLERNYTQQLPNNKKGEFYAQNNELKAYFMANIHFGDYPEIIKIEKDIKSFFSKR